MQFTIMGIAAMQPPAINATRYLFFRYIVGLLFRMLFEANPLFNSSASVHEKGIEHSSGSNMKKISLAGCVKSARILYLKQEEMVQSSHFVEI